MTKAFPLSTLTLCLLAGLLVGGHASAAGPDPVLVGAGDIASCTNRGDIDTATLLRLIPGTVVALGDNAYESGSPDEYANCYDPTWGQYKSRTMPAPGNHDYLTPGAAGYYGYFGAAAGDPTKGYYSYNLGAWHIIVINSQCSAIGGCGVGSPQERWLRADLADNPRACTLAYWHHPRFSSGLNGNAVGMQPVWQDLYDYGADVVLNGHDHDYERFALQDPAGNADPVRGIREFVVGTGGRSLIPFVSPIPNSEVRNDQTYGVIQLTLHPTSYDWQFFPVISGSSNFADSGSGNCVNAPTVVGGITKLAAVHTDGSRSRMVTWLAAALPGVIVVALIAWYARRRTLVK